LALKLIVGLGNPGELYSETRHNLGFMVVDELARRYEVKLKRVKKWSAQSAKISVGDGVVLAQPDTFMNESGMAVQNLCSFYKVMPSSDLLVIIDDADLPLGRLRLKRSGSAGGHNGLRSIISQLGTEEFPRLRIGVGRQPGDLKNHVLGRFSAEEQKKVNLSVKRAADAAEVFVRQNIVAAMNRFNAAQVDEDQA
jgi:PTH1 family peptidyl-tRNA hydrolase